MTRIFLLLVLIVLGAQVCVFGAPVQSTEKGIMPPPALNIPYGAQVVTELNVSDDDLLGIAKQVLPDVLRTMAPIMTRKASLGLGKPVDDKDRDFAPLFEAISGVTNLRVVVAKTPKTATKTKLMKDVEVGVAKVGKFSKVLADTQAVSGFSLLFAGPDNGGYIGFVYDADQRMLYAARAVGNVDVPKLMAWATNLLVKYGGGVTTQLTPSVPAEPEGEKK